MKPKALFVMLILWLSFTTIQARSTEDVPDKGTYAKSLEKTNKKGQMSS